jgi:TRAP-type C4-dicarboxylate transport system substrate-binding protein
LSYVVEEIVLDLRENIEQNPAVDVRHVFEKRPMKMQEKANSGNGVFHNIQEEEGAMKRHWVKKVLVLAFVVAVGFVCAQAYAQDKVISLNYAHFMPAPTMQAQLSDQWCKEVEKVTNGKVKVTFYPGGTLSTAPQIYDGIVKGIADVGFSIFSYTRGRFPLTEVVDLPLGYKSGYVATKLINEYFKKFNPKEMDDAKVMYLHAHGPGILVTKTPVEKLDDLKGMKIRSTGLSGKIAAALGGAPVGMPITEAYDALNRGVAEGILTPVEALKQWKLAEVTKCVTENYGSAYSVGFFIVMNKDKWNSLPPDIQKAIEKVNEQWIEKTGKAWDEIDKEGKEFALGKGMKFIPLSKQEEVRWNERVKPILDDYVKDMKAKNLPGEEALKFAQDYLKANQK